MNWKQSISIILCNFQRGEWKEFWGKCLWNVQESCHRPGQYWTDLDGEWIVHSWSNLHDIIQVIERTGVRRSDPRLQQMMTKLSRHHKKHGEENTTIENLNLDLQTFSKYKLGACSTAYWWYCFQNGWSWQSIACSNMSEQDDNSWLATILSDHQGYFQKVKNHPGWQFK